MASTTTSPPPPQIYKDVYWRVVNWKTDRNSFPCPQKRLILATCPIVRLGSNFAQAIVSMFGTKATCWKTYILYLKKWTTLLHSLNLNVTLRHISSNQRFIKTRIESGTFGKANHFSGMRERVTFHGVAS